ncbi:Phosphoglycerate mutase-like protein AT74 [Glycine max]|nr:Phosphoglycerate mutase-like protein AT74 [Glycine max]
MVGVLPKRRIVIWRGESHENWDTTTYITIPDHSIQSLTQGMTQVLRTSEHLCHVMGSDDGSHD